MSREESGRQDCIKCSQTEYADMNCTKDKKTTMVMKIVTYISCSRPYPFFINRSNESGLYIKIKI